MIINFNKKFYNLRAIKRTVKAYQNLAEFDIKEKKEYIKVKINKIDKEVKDIIKDEFCNYALAISR